MPAYKPHSPLGWLPMVFALAALPAYAATAAEPQSSFKAMDANGDGRVSRDEHAAGAKRMFDAMDANKDGRVTAAEMDAAHEKVTGKKAGKGELSSAEKIRAVDADGDGILTAAEHAAGSKAMFDRMDTNRDGFLGADEFAAGHAKMLRKNGK